MREIDSDEVELVFGGELPGPNGEGCTEPRKNDREAALGGLLNAAA